MELDLNLFSKALNEELECINVKINRRDKRTMALIWTTGIFSTNHKNWYTINLLFNINI